MQNSQLPLKWYKPFASDDSAKVEIPVTTADPTRASQSAGFPPLTMQPPESGGVPPQGEDFNGAMNQVARVAWWLLAGGALPFDAAWAGNANIVGYPQGATVASADLQGDWISTADNNTNNPDTVGTGWVPGYNYGSTAVAVTVADVTLTPAQAAKPILIVSGAMTAARSLIVPAWSKSWIIVNNTTGGFALTIKTAAGAGVVVSQGGGTQVVWGDGVNLIALTGNSATPLLVGTATQNTQATQLGQFKTQTLASSVATAVTSVTWNFTPPVSGQLKVIAHSGTAGLASGQLGLGIAGLPSPITVSNAAQWYLATLTSGAALVGGTPYSIVVTSTAPAVPSQHNLGAVFLFTPN